MPAFRLAVAPAVLAWATVGLFAVMAFLRLFRPDWVWRLHVYRMRTEGLTQLARTDAWERRNALHGILLLLSAVVTAGAAVALSHR